MPDRQALIEAFETQQDWCDRMGSPMYAALLGYAAADLTRAGPTRAIVASLEGNPTRDAVPLRLLGGVQRLVLEGRVPELARF